MFKRGAVECVLTLDLDALSKDMGETADRRNSHEIASTLPLH